MAKVQSWEVSDSFWARVEPLIPKPKRDPNKAYKRKPGGGRKPMPARQIFERIVYVLRTGCQWRALPKEKYGSPSTLRQKSVHTLYVIPAKLVPAKAGSGNPGYRNVHWIPSLRPE